MIVDSNKLFQQLLEGLTLQETRDEKEAILFWVLEHTLKLSRTEVMRGKTMDIDNDQIQAILHRLNQHEPVQYILGEADFYGRKFKVDPSVLITRPETELLVGYAINHFKKDQKEITVLDIGTGSGCIAITLALEIPSSKVIATDISAGALLTAKENAQGLGADVEFHLHNILKDKMDFGYLDLVVSNPPYIMESEKSTMALNVTEYEPPQALFVPDSDPLLFFRIITEKAFHVLKPQGVVIVEINERFGEETMALLQSIGFKNVNVLQDLSNKDRIITACR